MLLSVFGLWLIYCVCYALLKSHDHSLKMAGYLALVGEMGLDIVLVVMCFAMLKLTGRQNKKILCLLLISYLLAILADGIYNLTLNVLLMKNTVLVDSLYDIPFIGFLLFQAIAWFYIFKDSNKSAAPSKSLLFYFPYIFTAILIFCVFMFAVHWQLRYTSTIGFYQIIDTVLEAIGFSFATMSMIRARTPFVQLLGIGYLTVVASDFMIRYGVVNNIIIPDNTFEATWVLGLLLSTAAFFLLSRNRTKPQKTSLSLTH